MARLTLKASPSAWSRNPSCLIAAPAYGLITPGSRGVDRISVDCPRPIKRSPSPARQRHAFRKVLPDFGIADQERPNPRRRKPEDRPLLTPRACQPTEPA